MVSRLDAGWGGWGSFFFHGGHRECHFVQVDSGGSVCKAFFRPPLAVGCARPLPRSPSWCCLATGPSFPEVPSLILRILRPHIHFQAPDLGAVSKSTEEFFGISCSCLKPSAVIFLDCFSLHSSHTKATTNTSTLFDTPLDQLN